MAKPLRVGIVGAGYFSRFHYDSWTRIPETTLVACTNRDRAKAEAMAAAHGAPVVYDDLTAMLDGADLDVLDVVTPPETHLDTIREAAKRGIKVVCQKAFCRSLDEAREAAEVAEAAGVPVIVHENFRFQPWHREIRRLVAAGELGTVYQASFRLRPGDGQGREAYLDRQPYFQQMPRFLVHETAIHFVDTFRFLLGEVSAVYADLRRLNPVIAGEDAGLILFDHTNGSRSVFDGNRLSDHRAANRRLTMGEMIVEGERGVLRLDGEGGLWRRAHGSNDEMPVPFAWQNHGFGGDCVRALNQGAVDFFLGRGPSENLARDYLPNLVIEEAIYRSAESGHKQVLAF